MGVWGPCGVETTETTAMGGVETAWGPSGGNGDNMGMTWGQHGDDRDDMGMTGTMWGPGGPRGNNEITKNAITFKQIKIIEFCLKIWDL